MFAITQQEADVAPEVMTSTIQVFDSDAYVLIDPGATHPFISVKFIAQVNIECDAPKPGGPWTARQPAENLFVSYRETHT